MILSTNREPHLEEFQRLMERTDRFLNDDCKRNEKYYLTRNGTKCETDVYNALLHTTEGTPFFGTVRLVSGASFPDIILDNYYGVEVKTTQGKHWKSVGSSILESTRKEEIKRIYLTFGKLSHPVGFISRPYEECLYDIAVTHYPRYLIDMETKQGKTIFDRLHIDYDTLREMDEPVKPVADYYRRQLKPGESLWWAPGEEDAAQSPILKLWTALSTEDKNTLTVQGYALFPEILRASSTTKYQRYALWMATARSVINTNIRDQFSAGGKIDIRTGHATYERMPAAFGRIQKNARLIRQTIENASEDTLKECWQVKIIDDNRLMQWCRLVSRTARTDTMPANDILEMLMDIFGI